MWDYNYIFVLGYDLLHDFISVKPCECDGAFEFCKIMYKLFLQSEFNTADKPEYDCLQQYINSWSYEELDKLYWSDWSTL